MSAAACPPRRVRARIDGATHGSLSPFAGRLARELGLAGHVREDERGAVVEVEGPRWAVEAFLVRLRTEPPATLGLHALRGEELRPTGARGFEQRAPDPPMPLPTAVMPDTAPCRACVTELWDPADRRYRHPFISCAACGPRYALARAAPDDPGLLTMAPDGTCARCRREHDDPRSRRYHAPAISCPDCGPRMRLLDPGGAPVAPPDGADAVAAAGAALRAGRIVAVKGLTAYHLFCRADDEAAVAALRARTRRPRAPLFVMVGDLQTARDLVLLGEGEEALLLEPRRPVVLARSWAGGRIAPSVAPDGGELGVMLPPSALHLLLIADAGVPLVRADGTVDDEPVACDDEDARVRLGPVADLLLVHDRPIAAPLSDSVARVVELAGRPRPLLLRRARGHVPAPLELPQPTPALLLGVGVERDGAPCVAVDRTAWLGPPLSDLRAPGGAAALDAAIVRLERLFAAQVRAIAHDLQPDDAATRHALALARGGAAVGAAARPIAVQHHHAHLAACLAEHGERGPAVGVVYDGGGHGLDGTAWGGELLVGDLARVRRAGFLRPVRMPGGARAIREPWRMACAWAQAALGADAGVPRLLRGRVEPGQWAGVAALARSGIAAPVTTSMARLLDAVAALCGLHPTVARPGQAADALAAVADAHAVGTYPLPPLADGTLDGAALVRAVLADLDAGVPIPAVAASVHAGIARATATAAAMVAERHRLELVVLAGDVFENRLLLERTAAALSGAGLHVLVPERLPIGDGAIAFGQVAVAAARLAAGR